MSSKSFRIGDTVQTIAPGVRTTGVVVECHPEQRAITVLSYAGPGAGLTTYSRQSAWRRSGRNQARSLQVLVAAGIARSGRKKTLSCRLGVHKIKTAPYTE